MLAWVDSHDVKAAVDKFKVTQPTVERWQASAANQRAETPRLGEAPTRARAGAGQGASEGKTAPQTARRESRSVAAQSAVARSKRDAVQPKGHGAGDEGTQAQCPAAERARHARRYAVAEKQVILKTATREGVTAAWKKYGAARCTIYDWQRRAEKATTTRAKQEALAPRSSRPKHNGRKLDEQRYHLIADTWKSNQALGPRQVRNLLRRTHALRVGTSTCRRVMEEHGYVPPKITVERKDVRRYEAVRRNQMFHLDFVQFHVHKAKVYLLLIEDDFSRFLVGWALCQGERAQPAIEAFDTAVARHGRPEVVAVDAGSAFFSFRGQSQLERVCGDYGCDFVRVTKRGNGKLEALNANIRKELLGRVEFADLDDARRQIGEWVRGYNFERVHEGLGGLLVPADRYFGRADEVLAQIERGEPVAPTSAALPEARPLELFRVLSRGGRPELWLLGDRIWPPPQSS